MATISLGFNLSASAVQMASGINAGVVELEKLGLAAKKTQRDVSTLKTIELSRAFISTVRTASSAFASFIGGTAGAVASIDDLSKRTGITTDVLQAYSLAANQSGVGLETFGRAVQKLTINLGEAQTGNKAAVKSFADLGLSVGDLSNLNPEQAFNAVVAAISKLPNPAQQAAAAVSLFGKSGVELVPIFQEGATYLQQMTAEAKRLGIVLSPQQTAGIAALDDSLQKTQLTLQSFAARVVAQRAPAHTRAAEEAATFIASIDIKNVASALTSTVSNLASVFQLLATSAAPLAGNILPLIGGYLAFINRQVVASAVSNLSGTFIAAAASAYRFAGAAGVAAVGVRTLAASIRGLLASTGIGILVTVLGLLAGQVVEWSLATNTAGQEVAAAIDSPTKAAAGYRAAIAAATKETQDFGKKAKDALKVPTFTAQDLAQEAIDEASSAVKSLAKELGGLNRVPAAVLERFREIKGFAEGITTDSLAFGDAIQLASRDAQALTTEVRNITDARKADAEAAKAAADAARKAAEEARQRTAELANAGLSDAEKSRLQLNKDLLAIVTEQRAAEKALSAAQRDRDSKSVAAARQRLALSQLAIKGAKAEDRERQLQALGVDKNILKPATTLADQFKSVRQAFDKKLIDGGEAQTALRNLAKEGIDIRKEISRELSRPAASALNVNDIRTSEGISSLFALGREDPAIAQRRDQLKKLEEIKQGLLAIGASPVEILGS
jgi:hypothetical protein